MVLTKKDTFLPYAAMNDKKVLAQMTRKYKGMPIQVEGSAGKTKGLWVGFGPGAGSYYVKILTLSTPVEIISRSAFHNDWSDIKIDFRHGVSEVKIGEDVDLTQEERRNAFRHTFHPHN